MHPNYEDEVEGELCRKLLSKNAEAADSGKLPELHVLERTDGRAGRWSVVHSLYPLLQESGGEQVTDGLRTGFITCLNIVFF